MKDIAKKQLAKDQDYLLFIGIDENIVLNLKGVLNNIIEGNLILTDKKLFFYFRSNVSRDKVFIATYPYIFAVQLKEGFINSTLIIESKKESYAIGKINKKDAREFYKVLYKISNKNKSLS